MRLETIVLFAVLSLGCCVAASALAGNSPAYDRTEPTGDDIRALMQRLGSAAFKKREAAELSLLAIGDATIPYLRRATRDDRLEIVTRARRLLSLLEARDDDWR